MVISPFSLGKFLVAAAALQGGSLDLAEVIRQAQSHSAEVQIAASDLRAARARIGQQDARRRPQVGIAGTATRYDDRSMLGFGGQNVEVVPDHLETLTLQLDQLLDFTNQVGTAVSQARLYALSAQYGLTATSESTALEATTRYYELLRTEQSVRVAQASLDAYQAQLKTNTRLYEGGVGQKIDVLRAQSQVADAERELVREKNDRNAALSKLNDLIGRPLDSETILVPSAGAPAEAAPVDRPALIQQAIGQRTEVLAAETEVRAAEKGIKLARASTEPRVSVSIAGNYYPTTSFQYVRQSTAGITLGVSIPLYDGGQAQERVREARAMVDAAKAREDRVRRDVALQVQTAALDVETARKRLEASNVAVASASAARDLAQQRYEAQVGVYLEVTDAQAALTQAQAAQVDATYDLLTAQARLTRALGRPLLDLKAVK